MLQRETAGVQHGSGDSTIRIVEVFVQASTHDLSHDGSESAACSYSPCVAQRQCEAAAHYNSASHNYGAAAL